MSREDNGGPAFPCTEANYTDAKWTAEGLSVRDYFAAKAPSVPDDFSWIKGETDIYMRMTRWNYFYADAMLAERTKT